jgi:hypothetical protein
MSEPTTHTVDVPGAVLTYDVREPVPPSRHRPLFVFGSPMAASGFSQPVSHVDDRTVITYDPRVSERSKLEEGAEVSYEVHGDAVTGSFRRPVWARSTCSLRPAVRWPRCRGCSRTRTRSGR